MKKPLILSFLLLFFVSCAQIQALQDEPPSYDSQSEKILTEKAEDRGINLPTGSTIIEGTSGFSLNDAFGGLGSGAYPQANSFGSEMSCRRQTHALLPTR